MREHKVLVQRDAVWAVVSEDELTEEERHIYLDTASAYDLLAVCSAIAGYAQEAMRVLDNDMDMRGV